MIGGEDSAGPESAGPESAGRQSAGRQSAGGERPGDGGSGRRAVFFSQHVLTSRRRAGMYFLARAYHALGWRVTFVTVGLSWLSTLKRDPRLEDASPAARNRLVEVEPGLFSYAWMPAFHPINPGRLAVNRLAGPLFRLYPRLPASGLAAEVAAADHLVFESSAGAMLVPWARALNPGARMIYRVSDDLRVLGAHPVVIAAEQAAVPEFALISVPSPLLAGLFPGCGSVRYQPHGLNTAAFDRPGPSPYGQDEVAVVSVGDMLFDAEAAAAACAARPDWRFHFFGGHGHPPDVPNAVRHGERAFDEIVPYVRHARLGAAFYRPAPGAAYLADTSNKLMQYAYCRLPAIAPDFVADDRPHLFGYRPGDPASVADALRRAETADCDALPFPAARPWTEVAAEVIACADAGPA